MLRLGRSKSARLVPVAADALALPFPDRTFDGAMVGWGARNLADLDAGLREAARVLKPGARLVILEMSLPPNPAFRRLFLFYFHRILPWVGRAISKHTNAYTWLPESTRTFPAPGELARRMEQAGFQGVEYKLHMGGVTAMHLGTRRGTGDAR
jgi:demethylmenaquinone methyltransferase/2-methoxy-6-polyprenyl-1,4-benzoquinol methylase